MYTYNDNKGFRLLDVFELSQGQLNVQYFPDINIIAGMHLHPWEDRLICLKGSFRIGFLYEYDKGKGIYGLEWKFLSDKEQNKEIVIPSNIWHGFRAMETGSILLYHMSEKYDIQRIKTKPIDNKDVWFV